MSEFISRWQTTGSSQTITLPYESTGTYSGTIDWGDGLVSANTYANRSHVYSVASSYTITISGDVTGFKFNNTGSRLEIREILQWGSLRGLNNSNVTMFFGCSNLVLTGVTDTPDLSGITATTSMFKSCVSATTISGISSWDTSSVVNMSEMFNSAIRFNDDIGNWNVSGVTNMSYMFNGTSAFNNLSSTSMSGWNVSNVTNMEGMFRYGNFNQDIGAWNVGNVTTMESMFLHQSNIAGTGFNNV